MPRPPLVLLLLAACLGCDAGKFNDLARQAAGVVAEDAVVTTDDAVVTSDDARDSELPLGDFYDNLQRLADTLTAMQDERSARANLGRFKRIVLRLRDQQLEMQAVLQEDPLAIRPQSTADKQRVEETGLRLLAETSRIEGRPEIYKIVQQAYRDLKIDRSPFQFGGPRSPPTQPAESTPVVGALAGSPPPTGFPARPSDSGIIPIPPGVQKLRDSFEREKQRAAAGIPAVERPEPLSGPGILTIIVENMPAGGHHDLVRRCTAITSPDDYQSHSSGDRFEFRINHTEDVNTVSKKITFATVTSIDQSSRTITAKY